MKAPSNSELTTETHVFFLRGVFSNFTSTPMMQYKGHSFQTTEQAFMWAKAQLFGDKDSARLILAEKNPAKAKELGRGVKGFNPTHWDINKEFLMYEVNLAKYSQFDDYKSVLLSTGDKELVEANGRPDLVWSWGLYVSHKDILNESKWPGQNLLGKVLMKIREELRSC